MLSPNYHIFSKSLNYFDTSSLLSQQQSQTLNTLHSKLTSLTQTIRFNNTSTGQIEIHPQNLIKVLAHNITCFDQIQYILYQDIQNQSKRSQKKSYINFKTISLCKKLIPSCAMLIKNLARWIQAHTLGKQSKLSKRMDNQTKFNHFNVSNLNYCKFCQKLIEERNLQRVLSQIAHEPRLHQVKMLIQSDQKDLDDQQQKKIIEKQIVNYNMNQIQIKSKTAKADTYLTSLVQHQQNKYYQLMQYMNISQEKTSFQFNPKFINKFIQQFSRNFHEFYTKVTRKTLQNIIKRIQEDIRKQIEQQSKKQQENLKKIKQLISHKKTSDVYKKGQKKNSLFIKNRIQSFLTKKSINNDSKNTINFQPFIQNEVKLNDQYKKAQQLIQNLRLQLSKLKSQNQTIYDKQIDLTVENRQLLNTVENLREEMILLNNKIIQMQIERQQQKKVENKYQKNNKNQTKTIDEQTQTDDLNINQQQQQFLNNTHIHKWKSKKMFKSTRTFRSSGSQQVQKLQKLYKRQSQIFSIAQIKIKQEQQQQNINSFKRRRSNQHNNLNFKHLISISNNQNKKYNQINHAFDTPIQQQSKRVPKNHYQNAFYRSKTQSPQINLQNYQMKINSKNKNKIILKLNQSPSSSVNETSSKTIQITEDQKLSQNKIKTLNNNKNRYSQNKDHKINFKKLQSLQSYKKQKLKKLSKSSLQNLQIKQFLKTKNKHYYNTQHGKQQKNQQPKSYLSKQKQNLQNNHQNIKNIDLPRLSSYTIQTFHYFHPQNSVSLIQTLRDKKKITPISTLRSSPRKSISGKIFTFSDLDLFGGVSQGYKFNSIKNLSNEIKNKLQEKLLSQNQNQLIKEIIKHINQLSNFNCGIYNQILHFLKNPWKTITKGSLKQQLQENEKPNLENKIKQIFVHHKNKCKNIPCSHICIFLDKIGMYPPLLDDQN